MTARNMDEPRTPSLADLMLRMARSSTAGSQHCLPATVTRYDAVKQCVDAQPTIQSERIDEDGTVVAERLPPVLNAPVMFYGSGDYRDTFPIEVGAVVILFFTSASMERWLSMGGEVAPADGRRHTLSDAVAYPGGHSFAGPTKPGTTAPTNARVFHGQNFKFGGPSSAKRAATLEDLLALKAIFDAWAVVPMDGGAALKAALTDWQPTGSPRIKLP